jgi:hypothetical protein
VRLFVGCDGTNCDLESQAVLEYTARARCSQPLAITWMHQAASGPWAGWACASGRTPFTHFRWSVPAVCNYEGRAIYTDSDFLFRADLAELWAQPIPAVALVRNATGKLSTSCILFDCARAYGTVPDLVWLRGQRDAHGALLTRFRNHPEWLSPTAGNWDCPDLRGTTLDDPTVKAIHYTRIETQLHLPHALPRLRAEGRRHWYQGEIRAHDRPELQALFDDEYAAAQAAGYTVDRYRVAQPVAATRKDFRYKAHRGGARL